MTKRYYYDCAIEAAYMTKNFGFTFVSEGYGNELIYRGSSEFGIQGVKNGIYAGDKHYLAPESLPLLEPKLGDAVEIDRWINERDRNHLVRDAPYAPTFANIMENGSYLSVSQPGCAVDYYYMATKA